MDTVVETPKMPKAGETIAGRSVTLVPGGKGANQAYAAGKLGGQVAMVGAVADDSFGRNLKRNLEAVGVDTSGVVILEGETTGQAFITVDDKGENSIIIIAGTNGKVSKELIDQKRNLIEDSDIVIMQLEIPLETVKYVKDMAMSLGKCIIIDPAPAAAGLPDGFWNGVDYIKPNETELEILVGRKMKNREEILQGAKEMVQKGVKTVLVSLGAEGCLYVTNEKEEFFPAHTVNAIDTTAAGDSFTAAFALALSEEKNYEEAIRFGQRVAAICVTRKGAQTSIPAKEEVQS